VGSLRDDILKMYDSGNRLQAVMIELTNRCPASCVHCLLVRDTHDEMNTQEVLDLLDQLRAEGTFNLALTGGEPFMRSDLAEILAAANRHRFFISILTTAITVGPDEVEMMKANNVKRVEVSLLGATPETHDTIMNFPGAFHRTMQAVRLMVAAGLGVRLKTTVMSPNVHELEAMRDLAGELGTKFKASISVSPRVDGDLSPLDLALTRDQVAALDPTLINDGLIPGEDPSAGALLTCRAGNTVGCISPQGDVFPCLLFRYPLGNLRRNSLQEILHDKPDPFLETIRTVKPEEVTECNSCDLKSICQRCPGVAWIETGDMVAASPSACVRAEGMAAGKSRKGQP
jgi:AdoMet-dependent heme synthase